MRLTRRRLLIAAAAASVVAPARAEQWEWRGAALGAEARIVLKAPRDAAQAALAETEAEIERLERLFSLHRPDSQLARLNRNGRLAAPARDFTETLAAALDWRRRTDGAFDAAVQPLWAHHAAGAAGEPPLDRVVSARIAIEPGRVTLSSGAALTLNGLAQGVIADRVAALLLRRGFAAPMIDAGEMRLPGAERRRALIPEAELELALADCALATSAPSALRFNAAGRHHLFDPRTGENPNWHRSVTVIAPTAAEADALSTAFAISTPERIGDLAPIHVSVIATEATGRIRRYGRPLETWIS